MEVKGTIVEIFETVEVTSSFKKREFVIEYAENPTYPEYPKFELIQDKCESMDQYTAGQEVTVSFNLKGRKWVNPQGETQYFNSLQAWRINGAQDIAKAVEGNKALDETLEQSIENDNLPF
jgi:hypothetical protein